MADTIDIAGHKENKWVVYSVVAGGAVVAYFVWKQHKAGAASSATGMITDPSTGVQYPANGTDPVTGETYSQEIGQYGSVESADQAVQLEDTSYLTDSGNLYGTGYYGGAYSTGTYGAGTTVSGTVYTSNSAWSQAATSGLQDIGYTGTDVATALGLYLSSMPLTTDQAAIVQAAIAEYGPPPVGSFQIISAPAGNTTSTTTVAVPNVVGDTLADAQSAVQSAGLIYFGPSTGSTVATQYPAAGTQVQPGSAVSVTANAGTTTPPPYDGGGSSYTPPPVYDGGGTTTTTAPPAANTTPTVSGGHVVSVNNTGGVVAWTGKNATSYQVQLTGPGSENGRVNTVPVAQATYSGLESRHNYQVTVTPIGANGQRGVSGVITFTTS